MPASPKRNQASVQEVDRRNKRIRRAVQRNRPAIRRRDQVINRHIAGERRARCARKRQVCDVGCRIDRNRTTRTGINSQIEGTREATEVDVATTSRPASSSHQSTYHQQAS